MLTQGPAKLAEESRQYCLNARRAQLSPGNRTVFTLLVCQPRGRKLEQLLCAGSCKEGGKKLRHCGKPCLEAVQHRCAISGAEHLRKTLNQQHLFAKEKQVTLLVTQTTFLHGVLQQATCTTITRKLDTEHTLRTR